MPKFKVGARVYGLQNPENSEHQTEPEQVPTEDELPGEDNPTWNNPWMRIFLNSEELIEDGISAPRKKRP